MKRLRVFHIIKSEAGVSAVEFGLIAPLLFVITFAIIEFGILLFDKAVVTNASREGARAAIVHREDADGYNPLTEAEIETIVQTYADSYLINLGPGSSNDLTAEDITVTYTNASGTNMPESGGDVTVTVDFTYDFLVFPDLSRLIGGTFNGTIDLVGTTVMRME